MTDDPASGFQRFDRASDFEVFSSCLTLIDSLPFFAECKRESYDPLNATPGRRILEVGCPETTPRRWRSALLRAVRSSRSTGAKR